MQTTEMQTTQGRDNAMNKDINAGATAPAKAPRPSRGGVSRGAAALAASPLFAGIGRAAGTDMRIAWWGSDDRHQKTLKVLKLFEQQNPGVTMTPEYGGLIGYQDKLSTEFA